MIFILCLQSYSQDYIFLKGQNDSISAKVLEVNPDNFKYKKYSNIDGPTYTIEKTKIEKVVYSNGDIEFYSKRNNENSNYATIYVIRPKVNSSWFNGMKISENDKIIGVLSSNTYLKWNTYNVDEEIDVKSSAEGTYKLTIVPVAGKTYYFKQDQKVGWVRARPYLEIIEEKEALKLLEKCEIGEQMFIE